MTKQNKIIAIVSGVILTIVLGFTALRAISNWYDSHEIKFNKVLTMEWKAPITIEERKLEIQEIINVIEETPTLENLTPIEEYICEKWGVYNCKTAIAVASAESRMREDAWNANTNGSIDVGIFQINSVHFNKPGCSLKELTDQYKNVDCAYSIYEASGWSPWVAFKTGAFREYIK